MADTIIAKDDVIKNHQLHSKDRGSVTVQIALLTADIKNLTVHLKEHPKDVPVKRVVHKKVAKRRALLRYLARKDNKAYLNLIKKLNLKK